MSVKTVRPRAIVCHEASFDHGPALCAIVLVLLLLLSTVYTAQHARPLESTEHFVAEGL